MSDIRSKLAKTLQPNDTHERCGFVTKRGRIVEVKNASPTPESEFHIDPRDTIKWLEKGVVATWHTHPRGIPNLSTDDYEMFIHWDDLVHYVIGIQDGEVAVVKYVIEDGLVVQDR